MDRAALAGFLRTRREALRPEDLGLPAGVRRRAPGLRREEVASLAAMSTDYYTRLEQQRGPQPSEQLLSSLARALRLSNDERRYLFQVAGHNAPSAMSITSHVVPSLLRVMDRLEDTPAMILSELAEALVQNRMAKALFGDRTQHTGLARSEIYRWFTDPGERRVYPVDYHDWHSRALIANLRAASGSLGNQSRVTQLVDALTRESAEFARLWARQEVARRFVDHKILLHPQLGEIELDCQVLHTEDNAQHLLVLTAAPRSEAEEKLALLAVLGTERFAVDA
ncbi:MAG TPA: helix-turn-helix transcriptional regulator [Pseudonocardiaceae bacterium]|nr:helix-turn-helix transcriptional regulator [Pseudonocardiaceae bacterium]